MASSELGEANTWNERVLTRLALGIRLFSPPVAGSELHRSGTDPVNTSLALSEKLRWPLETAVYRGDSQRRCSGHIDHVSWHCVSGIVPNNYSNDLPSFAAWTNKYFAFNGNARNPAQIKISFLRFEYPIVIVRDLSLLHGESPIQIASVLYFPKGASLCSSANRQ